MTDANINIARMERHLFNKYCNSDYARLFKAITRLVIGTERGAPFHVNEARQVEEQYPIIDGTEFFVKLYPVIDDYTQGRNNLAAGMHGVYGNRFYIALGTPTAAMKGGFYTIGRIAKQNILPGVFGDVKTELSICYHHKPSGCIIRLGWVLADMEHMSMDSIAANVITFIAEKERNY